ncbi:MAG TPA: phosphate ABC transporter permease PstA [Streptosporangiaceae bacterium]|nr:phosphate ABC transporter permease PstA [Streptosporangiaceae bacterium]
MTAPPLTPRTPRAPLGAGDSSLSRRHARDRAMTVLLAVVMAVTLAVLAWVLVYVAAQGLKYLGPAFFTRTPPGNPAQAGGGYANGIIGSLIVVGIATLISVPVGIAAAIAIIEYGGRLAAATSFVTDVLVGVPSIVTGAFVYALWVTRFGFSGLAGSIALAIIMLPLVIRGTAEMLRLVPVALREASSALGVTRARTIVSVVLPAARAGITTGVMLAVARAMGETAPLLLTTLGNSLFIQANPTQRMSTLSLQIFGDAVTGFQAAQARAWAGALTLILIVLILYIAARLIGRRLNLTRS